MPLWAESRIHGDVYVRFGGRLSETYHRKVAWRRQPSLQVTNKMVSSDFRAISGNLAAMQRSVLEKRDRKQGRKKVHRSLRETA